MCKFGLDIEFLYFFGVDFDLIGGVWFVVFFIFVDWNVVYVYWVFFWDW